MYERTYNSRVLKTDDQPSKKKKRGWRWKRILIIVGIVGVIVGIVVLIRSAKFQVQSINVVGASVSDPVDISTFALNTLDGTYAWILPRTSVFLISPESIAEAVREAFPRLSSVVVDRDGVDSLRLVVTEYPGVYLWCDEECSFMDETGTVFADAPYFSGSAYLKIYVGTREQFPFNPISPQQIQLIATLKERLEAIDIVPLSMRFESEHKLTVGFIHQRNHAVIYMDPTENVETTLETLYSALRTETVARLYRDPTQRLEYLDVRFANKLIYKFQ